MIYEYMRITENLILFRITSENGVSNQSMGTKQLRTVQHVATTTEGGKN